jgi:hypothetical protein
MRENYAISNRVGADNSTTAGELSTEYFKNKEVTGEIAEEFGQKTYLILDAEPLPTLMRGKGSMITSSCM